MIETIRRLLPDAVKTPEPQDHLVEDLGLDSIDLVELTIALENEFDIEISDDEAEQVQTVQQVMDLVEAKRCA